MQNGSDAGQRILGPQGVWRRLLAASGTCKLPAILLLAGLLRLLWIWFCPNQPISDQDVYHQAATAIARGEGFVDTDGQPHGWWPVGYSAALAPFHWLFGDAPRVGHFANLLFGLAAVFALHRLALAVAGPAVAAISALLLALHPTAVMMTTVQALENLYIPIVLSALALLVRSEGSSSSRWRAVLATGALLGLGAYVRAPSLLLLAMVPLWLLVTRVGLWRITVSSAVSAAVALLLLLPWGVRTSQHFGSFRIVSMNGMSNLWMGNHAGSDGGYNPLPAEVAGLSVPEREKELGARAIAFIREHPGQYLLLCVNRCIRTLGTDTIAVTWNEPGLATRGATALTKPLKALTTAAWWLLAAAALWSLWRRRQALDRGDFLLLACLAVLAFPFVAIVGGNRYHLPLGPILMLLAARLVASPSPR